jgi:outer membrane protein assembly factor BamB
MKSTSLLPMPLPTHHHFASALFPRLAVGALVMLLQVAPAGADDWPQWRGAKRDGVWQETGIMAAIPAAGLAVEWRAKVGNGYSGPVVAQERVYVTDHVFDPEVERVLCFDATTGKQLWAHHYPVDYKEMEYGNGPRATPTFHDGHLYTLGTQGELCCLHATTGGVVWQKNLVKDFNGRIPRYGAAAAPLVVGELLIVCAGGEPDACVVALDRHTGALRWKALAERPAYSAPIVITAGGCQQVIVWTADAITSLEPATGKVFWNVPWKATFDPAQMVASPVWHKDLLLCFGAWGRGSKMLQLDAAKPAATVLWETKREPTTRLSTPLFQDDGHFYAVLLTGNLVSIEARTGKQEWSTFEPTSKRMGDAHLTQNGDRVFLFNQSGHLILACLTPQGYTELGRCLLVEPTAGYHAQGPVAWAHPAYANRCVFARNDQELVCASLSAAAALPVVAPQQTIPSHPLAEFPGGNAALAFAPDGRSLAVGGGSTLGETTRLDLATREKLPAPARLKRDLCALTFSPDGQLLVVVGGTEFQKVAEVKVFDTALGRERAELMGHTDKVFAVACAPDGRTLATGGADQTVRLWDLATLKTRAVLAAHAGAVLSVAFSPDGKTLAAAGADGRVRLWDTATGKEQGNLYGHEEEVRAVVFSPDGRTLATGSADWTVRLWDVATQKERRMLKGHRGSISCLAFSPDGQTLATGSSDETVKLWDVATPHERATLTGHRSRIAALAFAPDGSALVSAGADDAVRWWDIAKKP